MRLSGWAPLPLVFVLLSGCPQGGSTDPTADPRGEAHQGTFSMSADEKGIEVRASDSTNVRVNAEEGVRVDAPGVKIRIGAGGVRVDIGSGEAAFEPEDEDATEE